MSTEQTPETDRIEMDIDVTATNGITVPISIVVTYPEGHGFYAAKTLQAMPDHMDGIWNDLIQRRDASTIKVMLASDNYTGDED